LTTDPGGTKNFQKETGSQVQANPGACCQSQTHRARGGGFGEALGSALCRDGRQGDGGREAAQAQIRVIVRRILRKYGYPPDKQEKTTQTVLEQAKLLCVDWAGE